MMIRVFSVFSFFVCFCFSSTLLENNSYIHAQSKKSSQHVKAPSTRHATKHIKQLNQLVQKLKLYDQKKILKKITSKELVRIERLIQSTQKLMFYYFQKTPPNIKSNSLKTYRKLVYRLLQKEPNGLYEISQQKVCLRLQWRQLLSKAWRNKKKWSQAIKQLTRGLSCYQIPNLWYDIAQLYKQMNDHKQFKKAMTRFNQSKTKQN